MTGLKDSSIVKVVSLHEAEEGRRYICDGCTQCRKCEGLGRHQGYPDCPTCHGVSDHSKCARCDGSGADPLDPQRGCPKCTCDMCRCQKCCGSGKPQRGVRWEVHFKYGVIGHFCSKHYHDMDWLCDVCGRRNAIVINRCTCRNVRPDECRKCHQTHLEGGLYKLVDGVCPTCNGLGINTWRARYHIERCTECTELEKADPEAFKQAHLDIVQEGASEEFPCGGPKYLCDDCFDWHNDVPTGVRQRSKTARWLITSIDIRDIDKCYHDELRPFVGQYICFRCACPDMQVVRNFVEQVDPRTGEVDETERYCLICQKEGIRLKLSRYNPGVHLCFRHRDWKVCVRCDQRLDVGEGPYCQKHTVCLASGCDERPPEGEMMCAKHSHIKGFGAFLDRGGFANRRSHKAASGFTGFSTSKAVNPAGMLAKWEHFERVQSIVGRRLTRAYDDVEKAARKLEMVKLALKGMDRMEAGVDRDLELRVLDNERGRHQKTLDDANQIIAKYQSLHNLFILAFERVRETEEGYVADIPTTELTPEETKKRIKEREESLKPKSVDRRIQCMVCKKTVTRPKPGEFDWVVGHFPGDKEIPRGKRPTRYLACRRCRGIKVRKTTKPFSASQVVDIQRERLINEAFGL